jgi:hypothetical protein
LYLLYAFADPAPDGAIYQSAVFDNILQNKGMAMGQAEEPNGQAVQSRQESQQSLYMGND